MPCIFRIGCSAWEVLETLIFQLAVIIAAFLPSWGFRAATRSRSDRLAQRIAAQFCWLRIPAELSGLVLFKGEVLLGLWDAFNEKGIELPIPQRGVHIRDLTTTVKVPGTRIAGSARQAPNSVCIRTTIAGLLKPRAYS